ncbi:tRNA (adenosine(37)-N6)-threonylcarbamoyltransferase complex transferase subunit TsaD [bacterium]|nr:tRNA (adenosine(37)-N6)-threonylcarbamoyltransferase complex transferase subunit TsaD [bacterium]
MIGLGIETSCDETSVAVIDQDNILSNVIYTQEIHTRYGGVVPELASREHLRKIVPTYREALQLAGIGIEKVNCVSVTVGPGLLGSLLVGISFAQGLCYANDIPLIGVNHLEGHFFSNYFSGKELVPSLFLIVSGGHTHLYSVPEWGEYHLLGRTRDDAAGEAYDKVAKALDLPYPGGPVVDDLAKNGNPGFIKFPRAMLQQDNYDFSFSGIKTAVVYYLNEHSREEIQDNLAHILSSFQEAVVDSLLGKLAQAVSETAIHRVVLAGGVSANSRLRHKLSEYGQENQVEIIFPPPILCTDNAAMTAAAGLFRFRKNKEGDISVNANPRLKLM